MEQIIYRHSCNHFYTFILLFCFLVVGVYVSLTSVVLVDLLGLEMLTNSFGLLLMFQGIATLIGPPIAGKTHALSCLIWNIFYNILSRKTDKLRILKPKL